MSELVTRSVAQEQKIETCISVERSAGCTIGAKALAREAGYSPIP